LPLPLAEAENGDEEFWKKKFHAANGKAQHALMKGPVFSFLKGQGERDIFLVPNVFSSNSQMVPKFSKCSQMHSSKCSQ
jgi:hypothetical protein